jgi:hypothetical protein
MTKNGVWKEEKREGKNAAKWHPLNNRRMDRYKTQIDRLRHKAMRLSSSQRHTPLIKKE